MKGSVVRQLILKDWRLHRMQIILSIAGGAAALSVVQIRSEVPFVLGTVWFFIALILMGSMLPSSNIVNERKKQTLPFLMSLPVSALQYTTAKIISTFGMFLILWLALVAGALSLIAKRSDIPHGFIPMALVLAGLTLVGFCLVAAAAIISESEGWFIAATIVCNSSYGVVWYLIVRVPAIRHDAVAPVPVWSPTVLMLLGVEFSLIALSLGLAFLVQSRKRDFVN